MSKKPKHLDKDFEQELNYQLWSTSRQRFNYAERLRIQHRLSTRSVACVTSYLIIYSIMDKFYPGNDFLSIIIIFLSIWILVFSLLEERGNYQIEAIDMDECANKINQLYNRLRFCKSYLKNQEKIDEIKNISDEYRDVLKRYKNHHQIDRYQFLCDYKKYHKINWFLSLMYKIKIYIVTRLKYDFVIIIPLVYLIYLIFTEMLKK